MLRNVSSVLLLSIVPLFFNANCLKLDLNPGRNLPLLLSANRPIIPTVYLFLDGSGLNAANGLLRMKPSALSDGDAEFVRFNNGPSNIDEAAVVDGVIYAIEADSSNILWISRNRGRDWTSFEPPDDNEDEDLSRVLGCEGAVVIAYDSFSIESEGDHPAYASYDDGRSFQKFYAPGTESLTIQGMDCHSGNLYVASNQGQHLIWSSVQTPGQFTLAASHSSTYETYEGLIAGDDASIGVAEMNGDNYLNYSLNYGKDMQYSGQFPVNYRFEPSGADGGADFGANYTYISMADTLNTQCRIYKFANGQTPPSDAPYAQPSCEEVLELGGIPALLAVKEGVLVSYRSSDATDGGLLLSIDGGLSYQGMGLDQIWAGPGYVSDMAATN